MSRTRGHRAWGRAAAILIATVVMCAGLVLVNPVPAQAAANCRHSAGNGVPVAAKRIVTDVWQGQTTPSTVLGAAQLCRDGAGRYWGYLVFYAPMPAHRWANVWIRAYWGSQYRAEYSCAAPGGNGFVKQGETMCWTPKIYGTDPRWNYRIEAEAYRQNPNRPDDWGYPWGHAYFGPGYR